MSQRSGKLWGQTVPIEVNPFVAFHRAEIQQGFCCSRHFHAGRTNLFYCESGRVRIRAYQPNGIEDETILTAGDWTECAPELEHRFEGLADSVVFELYWPRSMTENDIVRRDTGGRMA
jgi:quercetin dioxygenase-like cupin family protein